MFFHSAYKAPTFSGNSPSIYNPIQKPLRSCISPVVITGRLRYPDIRIRACSGEQLRPITTFLMFQLTCKFKETLSYL